MSVSDMLLLGGGLIVLSVPLAYGLRTLMNLRRKRIYPVLRLTLLCDGAKKAGGSGRVSERREAVSRDGSN